MRTTKDLKDRAALAAFQALISQWKGEGKPPIGELARRAYEIADEFLAAKRQNELNQYFDILRNFTGLEALRRVMEKDGTTGRMLDFMVNQYRGSIDPLKAYASENICNKVMTGQTAINLFFQGKDAA
jgi:hypothetical protein